MLSDTRTRIWHLLKGASHARQSRFLLTHEQYFSAFCSRYLPGHIQRCEAAIRWAREHGYEPAFFHEGLLSGKR